MKYYIKCSKRIYLNLVTINTEDHKQFVKNMNSANFVSG